MPSSPSRGPGGGAHRAPASRRAARGALQAAGPPARSSGPGASAAGARGRPGPAPRSGTQQQARPLLTPSSPVPVPSLTGRVQLPRRLGRPLQARGVEVAPFVLGRLAVPGAAAPRRPAAASAARCGREGEPGGRVPAARRGRAAVQPEEPRHDTPRQRARTHAGGRAAPRPARMRGGGRERPPIGRRRRHGGVASPAGCPAPVTRGRAGLLIGEVARGAWPRAVSARGRDRGAADGERGRTN